MTKDEALECAHMICSVYSNTAGKEGVLKAYSEQLAMFPFKFTGAVLAMLPAKHDSQFCPSIPEILDALVEYYVESYRKSVVALALRVYPARYVEGDDEHKASFVDWYKQRVNDGRDPDRETVLKLLRSGEKPRTYLERIHRPLGPREGGPIAPPARKDREPRVCAAVRFGDWKGLLAVASGETT